MLRTLSLAALLLSACDDGGGTDAVRFDRLEVRDIDWTRVDTDLVFQIDNPIPVDLGLARMDWTLEMSGIDLLSGADADGFTLRGGQSSELALPVGMDFADLFDMVEVGRGQDTLPFTLTGTLGFDSDWGPLDLPFRAQGDFPALRAPNIKLAGLRMGEVSWQQAAVELDLTVDNDLGSTLGLADLGYALSIEGWDVADGLVQDAGAVEGAAARTVTLPVRVDLLQAAGAGVTALLGGGKVDVALAAEADVDTPFGLIPLAFDLRDGLSIQ